MNSLECVLVIAVDLKPLMKANDGSMSGLQRNVPVCLALKVCIPHSKVIAFACEWISIVPVPASLTRSALLHWLPRCTCDMPDSVSLSLQGSEDIFGCKHCQPAVVVPSFQHRHVCFSHKLPAQQFCNVYADWGSRCTVGRQGQKSHHLCSPLYHMGLACSR